MMKQSRRERTRTAIHTLQWQLQNRVLRITTFSDPNQFRLPTTEQKGEVGVDPPWLARIKKRESKI